MWILIARIKVVQDHNDHKEVVNMEVNVFDTLRDIFDDNTDFTVVCHNSWTNEDVDLDNTHQIAIDRKV